MKGAEPIGPVLERAGLRLASTLDLDQVLGEITRALVRDLDAALARVWLVGRSENDVLRLVASAGLSERLDGPYADVRKGQRKVGQIAASARPLATSDLLEDPRFSDKSWIVANGIRGFAGYPLVAEGNVLGVLAVFTRHPLSEVEVERLGVFAAYASSAIQNARLFAEVKELSRRLEAENHYLKSELDHGRASGIVGKGPAITRALDDLERVAKTSSTVLLLGETGTGKELFAHALHRLGPRHERALVKVNCAALAPTLLESELFGHEKGAFTGAFERRIGRFELADGGTIFLDEIGELTASAQVKLLRVLQERELERVGGTRSISVDVRIVAATHRDLLEEVRANRFREDLYFRLNVFPIRIPPLRERLEDLGVLCEALLRDLRREHGRPEVRLEADALAHLAAYDWPGNVRELHNVLERASILSNGPVIRRGDLPDLVSRARRGQVPSLEGSSLSEAVESYERALVAEALAKAHGNQSEAARLLGIRRTTLQYKMRVHGL